MLAVGQREFEVVGQVSKRVLRPRGKAGVAGITEKHEESAICAAKQAQRGLCVAADPKFHELRTGQRRERCSKSRNVGNPGLIAVDVEVDWHSGLARASLR